MTAKPASKISATAAMDEATQLLTRLTQAGSDGLYLGEDLCRRFTAVPRKEILEHIAGLLAQVPRTPPPDELLRFVRAQGEEVRPANLEEHVAVMVRAARALPGEAGEKLAAELVLELLRPAEKSTARGLPKLTDENLTRVARRVSGIGGILVLALQTAVQRATASRQLLARWYRAILPVLGTWAAKEGRTTLSQLDASSVLVALADLDATRVPDEILFSCPRLLALADTAARGQFLESRVGQVVQMLCPMVAHSSETIAKESGTDTTSSAVTAQDNIGERLSPERAKILVALYEFFRTEDEASKQSAAASESALRAIKQDLDEARESERLTKNRLREHSDQHDREIEALNRMLSELQQEKATLRDRLEQLEREIARLQGEAELREHETKAQFKIERQQDRERLSGMLSQSTRELRDQVELVIQSNPENNAIRRMGLAFDAVHKQLLRILNEPDSVRLPRELFARPSQ